MWARAKGVQAGPRSPSTSLGDGWMSAIGGRAVSGLHICLCLWRAGWGPRRQDGALCWGSWGWGQEACRLLLRPLWALCPRL